MIAVVQPLFESIAVFAWCLMMAVVPLSETPGPSHEQVAHAAADEIFDDMKFAVAGRHPDKYLARFSPELRDKFRGDVEKVLAGPKKHCLAMRYKLEPINVGSYEATYRVKILTEAICPTGYQDNVETAVVTIAPAAGGSDDGKFFSESSNDPAEMPWEITKWETEKVAPYDRAADRRPASRSLRVATPAIQK